MREIKFRAWDKDVKEFRKIGNIHFMDGLPVRCHFADSGNEDGFVKNIKADYGGTSIILQQFTGLKDKNGKEIYEGDIVEIKTVVSYSEDMMEQPEDYDQTIICKVFFNEAIACFDLETIQSDTHLTAWGFYGDNMDSFEVIGNIYSNPELIQCQQSIPA